MGKNRQAASPAADNGLPHGGDVRTALIVTGMHRSGTSALARVLSLLGADLPGTLMPAARDNPTGFWEPLNLARLHDEILAALGLSWDDFAPLPGGWIKTARIRSFKQRYAEILEREYGRSPLFVIKDPRLSRLLPLTAEVVRELGIELKFLQVVRNPLEVAASLKARNDFPFSKSLLLWLEYNLAAERAGRDQPRTLVAYDALLRDWRGVIRKAAADLDLKLPAWSAHAEAAVEDFLHATLRHHAYTPEEIRVREDVAEWVGTAYNALDHLTREEDRRQWRRLDRVRREFARGRIAFGTLLAQERLTIERLSRERDEWSAQAAGREREAEKQRTENTRLTGELENIRAVAAEHKRELDRSASEAEKLRRETSRLAGKLEQVRAVAAERKRDREQLRRELEQARVVAAERKRDNELLRHDLARTRGSLSRTETELKRIRASTSWRVTGPLRRLSRGSRRITGPAVRAAGRQWRRLMPVLLRGYRRYLPAGFRKAVPRRLRSGLKRRLLPGSIKSFPDRNAFVPAPRARGTREEPASPAKRLTVAVIAWDVCHNPLGRAYLLAEALSRHFQVVLLGPAFPRFGGRVWEPLENAAIPVVPLPGGRFPEFARTLDRITDRLGADVIIACKPRLPSLLFGHLLKRKLNRPLFVDIDDHELSFTTRGRPLTLDDVGAGAEEELAAPDGEDWTCFCENYLDGTDGLFVSNEVLRQRYGGTIIPHARDESLFDPGLYDRQALRRKLGLTEEDRLVLFAGTPRPHKGVLTVLKAVTAIEDRRVRMLVVGRPESVLEKTMRTLGEDRLIMLGNRPLQELPGYVACADAVCLLQDLSSPISRYQLPAKVSEALAFGRTVLATPVPPLKPLFQAGVITETSAGTLRRDLRQALLEAPAGDEEIRRRREYFLEHLSYARTGRDMAAALYDRLKGGAFASLNPLTPELMDRVTRLTRGEVPAAPAQGSGKGREVVLIWKQPDLCLYGRRPDMLIRYLAARPEVHRILVLEPPVSHELLVRWSRADNSRQDRSLYVEWLRKSWGVYDTDKVRFHNFTYSSDTRHEPPALWHWPAGDDYLDSLAAFFESNHVDPGAADFIVCPKNEAIPAIVERFKPRRVIADVVDDHRAWPNLDEHTKRALSEHYREVLGLSDFVITNCEPVRESMGSFHRDIRVLPNGVDLALDESRPLGAGYRDIRSLPRPHIGYVGNLETKIDTELLRRAALAKPAWQFILVGSVHANPEVLELDELPNVHLAGVVPYEEAKLWIRDFDVAMIPHRQTELTRHMNPLKFYLYLGLGVPVVSTSVDNLGELSRHIAVAEDADGFIEAIDSQLARDREQMQRELAADIRAHTWEQRVATLLQWMAEADRANPGITAGAGAAGNPAGDGMPSYTGVCTVCGGEAVFRREERPLRETYPCPDCRSSLRYRCQAEAMLRYFGDGKVKCIADLVKLDSFKELRVLEPGVSGPFRSYFCSLPGYRQTFYWPEVPRGEKRDGIECQDLMDLTCEDEAFDLIITSDIFEHIRKPWQGFREIARVLKPGGCHIFSIPVTAPMPDETFFRVDTSGDEDVFLVEPRYHGDGKGGRSLVYTDFGADMLDELAAMGMSTQALAPEGVCGEFKKLLTFVSRKNTGSRDPDRTGDGVQERP